MTNLSLSEEIYTRKFTGGALYENDQERVDITAANETQCRLCLNYYKKIYTYTTTSIVIKTYWYYGFF